MGLSLTVCQTCGFVHSSADATAIGRFLGTTGYRSTLMPDAPTRQTRDEAINDTCEYRLKRHER